MSPESWFILGITAGIVTWALIYRRWFMRRCPKCRSTEYMDLGLSYGCMEPGCKTEWGKDPLKVCPVARGCAGVDGLLCTPHKCRECLEAVASGRTT